MKKSLAPLSIRIIYWITVISQYLLGLVIIAAIAFNVLIYLNISDDLQLHTQFPVEIDFLEKGSLEINDQIVEVEFVEASSKIHFINTPRFIANKIAFAMLVVSIGFLYLLLIFKKFIKNVKSGNTFNIDNINILKKLSYGLVALWFFTNVYMFLFYHYIGTRIEMDGVRISSNLNDYSGILFAALLIWVIAHIFIKGLELQEEKDLTI